jgi:hypothetical protein
VFPVRYEHLHINKLFPYQAVEVQRVESRPESYIGQNIGLQTAVTSALRAAPCLPQDDSCTRSIRQTEKSNDLRNE